LLFSKIVLITLNKGSIMKTITLLCSLFALLLAVSLPAGTLKMQPSLRRNLTEELPQLDVNQVKTNIKVKTFDKVADVAQYGGGDWSKVVGIARNVSLEEAQKIASNDRKISYFFYMKGTGVTLNSVDGNRRAFRSGDAVFFSGTPQWGACNGISDGYVKTQK
jgi:hypothetical protein